MMINVPLIVNEVRKSLSKCKQEKSDSMNQSFIRNHNCKKDNLNKYYNTQLKMYLYSIYSFLCNKLANIKKLLYTFVSLEQLCDLGYINLGTLKSHI